MILKRFSATVTLVALGFVTFGTLNAQQTVPSSAEVQELYRRLEVAEQRITELQLEPKRTPAIDSATAGPYRFASSLYQDEEANGEEATGEAKIYEEIEGLRTDMEEADDDLASEISKAVFNGSSNVSMKITGRIHMDYWGFPQADLESQAFEGEDPEERFLFRRVRLGASGDINDNMEYKIEMEFASPNDTEYRDLYIGWNDLPFLRTLLIGNQKRPYGLDHLNSSRYNVFIERPFIIEAFNEDARRLGIASYGVSEDEAWNWRYGVYNLERTQDDDGYFGDELQLQFAARLANTIWYDDYSDGRGYAHWAVSGTIARPDGNDVAGDGNNNEARFRTRPEARTDLRWLDTGRVANARDFSLIGVEGVVNVGAFQVVGEYQNSWMNREFGDTDLDFGGGYVYISYFLTGEHVPWERDSGTIGRTKPFETFFLVRDCNGRKGGGWGAWQIAARYSYADLTSQDIFGGVGDAVTLGLNWWWNQNARMQFNLINGRIRDREIDDAILDGDYTIVGSRFMVDF